MILLIRSVSGFQTNCVSPQRVWYSVLDRLILALSFSCRFNARPALGSICRSGSVEPANTQCRKRNRYSSSAEKPLLQAVQILTTGKFFGKGFRQETFRRHVVVVRFYCRDPGTALDTPRFLPFVDELFNVVHFPPVSIWHCFAATQGEKLAEGLTGDIRPVSELYEYWCFFLLRRLLARVRSRLQFRPHKGE